jgi:flagellar biosynthesis protein FlhF
VPRPVPGAFAPQPPPAPAAHSAAADDARLERLATELSDVKAMLASRLATDAWSDLQRRSPVRAQAMRALLNAGFSPRLCSALVEAAPDAADADALLGEIERAVAARLRTLDATRLLDEGGVFAFIGPTGVGKTTTLAKVAARCVMRLGRSRVALLTTDTFRVGAQEQLRVFARILGLSVAAPRDSEDLASRLGGPSRRQVVLLDTAGVGQRDALLAEQTRLIRDGCEQVRRVLVMSATTNLRTLEDVIAAHGRADGDGTLLGAIVTKLDEAQTLAPVVDCLIRHDLPVLFLANGQRVPEDLYPPSAAYLANRAVRGRVSSAEGDVPDELVPQLIADGLDDWTQRGER